MALAPIVTTSYLQSPFFTFMIISLPLSRRSWVNVEGLDINHRQQQVLADLCNLGTWRSPCGVTKPRNVCWITFYCYCFVCLLFSFTLKKKKVFKVNFSTISYFEIQIVRQPREVLNKCHFIRYRECGGVRKSFLLIYFELTKKKIIIIIQLL